MLPYVYQGAVGHYGWLTPTQMIDALLDESIDLVVSVCDNAKESCPIFPRPVKRIHVPFHDPHGEPLDSFIAVRDEIRRVLVPAVVEALGLEVTS